MRRIASSGVVANVSTLDLLLDARATIAESLLWEPGEALLYWSDIKAPALFRLNPRTLDTERWELPEDIGGYALVEGQRSAVVALRSGLFLLSLARGSLERVADAPWDPERFRFNEGAVDAAGRFWVGCMCDPKPGADQTKATGPLHRWSSATGLVQQTSAAQCHNGMAWSSDGRTFYLSHSMEQTIYVYAFDPEHGTLGERTVFASGIEHGIPDGAAVDEDGAYWCAIHGGSRLHRYAPDGTLLQTVALPVSQPTMCAFGGPELRTLFISSATDGLSRDQLAAEPLAGALLTYDPGVRGLPRPTYTR